MSALIVKRQDAPKPFLKAGLIYSGDNGERICVHCAGMSAKFSGRDRSGRKVKAMTQRDADEWMLIMGKVLACEAGCTKQPPTEGVVYSPEASAAMFGQPLL